MSTENLNASSRIIPSKRINAGLLKMKVISKHKKKNLQNKFITIGIFLSIGIISYLVG